MRAVLSRVDINIELEILPGNDIATSENLNPAKVCVTLPEKLVNGASIGVQGNDDQAGSLGCFLKPNFSNGLSQNVVLTCCYVIADKGGPAKETINKNGLSIDSDHGLHILVQSPAALDLNESIQQRRESLAEDPKDEKMRSDLEGFLRLSANLVIGKVIAASGVRISKHVRRMDWALISTTGPLAKNKPPPHSAFSGQMPVAFPKGRVYAYKINEDFCVWQFAPLQLDSWVAKTGRTSGVTSGVVNNMQRLVHWLEYGDLVSKEVEVMGLVTNFASAGDSGSMVTDELGNLVGILIGRDSCAREFDVGFVTPIFDIQADVREKTGGFLSID